MDLVGRTLEKSLSDIVIKAKDYALLHALTMRSLDNSPDHLEFVPFTLFPSNFAPVYYNEAKSIQPIINKLMLRISLDHDFLRATLKTTASADEFTRRLLNLLEITESESHTQSVTLGLLRSDYMIDERTSGITGSRLKQIEINTIASGQGWLGTVCSRLHRYVVNELGLIDDYADNLVVNDLLDGLCRGLLEAWKIYGKPRAAILFVVEEIPRHIADQRYHEYKLQELEPRVRVLRLTLAQVAERATLNENLHRLLFIDGYEIALVYFRSGYSPEQYTNEAEWEARLTIERSAAIKCPTIGYHLAGTKKVQQAIAESGCLERFLTGEECEMLRSHFTGLYSLDFNEAGEDIVELAITKPENFVLKPQREGGSNNYFNEELSKKLGLLKNNPERAAWILMDRIRPVIQKNYLVRPGNGEAIKLCNVNSELGIFGVTLANESKIIDNYTIGHTLRTKIAESNEGGICSGYGACDSPLLL